MNGGVFNKIVFFVWSETALIALCPEFFSACFLLKSKTLTAQVITSLKELLAVNTYFSALGFFRSFCDTMKSTIPFVLEKKTEKERQSPRGIIEVEFFMLLSRQCRGNIIRRQQRRKLAHPFYSPAPPHDSFWLPSTVSSPVSPSFGREIQYVLRIVAMAEGSFHCRTVPLAVPCAIKQLMTL